MGRRYWRWRCATRGDVKEGERVAAPLRQFGKPIADVVAPHPYVAWQAILDPLLAPGASQLLEVA